LITLSILKANKKQSFRCILLMVTLQNLPEKANEFIKKNELVQSKAFPDERQENIQTALKQIISLVITSLAESVGQLNGDIIVWNAARGTSGLDEFEADLPIIGSAPPRGAGLVKAVLSDRYHGTISSIAKATVVKPTTVSKLIDIVTTATLELLSGVIVKNSWNAQQLGELLRPSQPTLASSRPLVKPVLSNHSAPVSDAELAPSDSVGSWLSRRTHILLAVVSLIAIVELGYIVTMHLADNNRGNTTGTTTNRGRTELPTGLASANRQYTAIPITHISSTLTSAKAAVPVVLKLKDGLRQVIGVSSTESKLYQFLIDPNQEVNHIDPTKGWIGFDRIYFETNKATLTNESLWQLSNVASILKRFPAAKVKVGGYTDSTGNPIKNLRLSKARAEAAKSSLISLGVSPDHLTAVGYGALDNITTNKTEEGRALNRRVSLQVTEK
jgi:OOP family OmpA-OmpF porin